MGIDLRFLSLDPDRQNLDPSGSGSETIFFHGSCSNLYDFLYLFMTGQILGQIRISYSINSLTGIWQICRFARLWEFIVVRLVPRFEDPEREHHGPGFRLRGHPPLLHHQARRGYPAQKYARQYLLRTLLHDGIRSIVTWKKHPWRVVGFRSDTLFDGLMNHQCCGAEIIYFWRQLLLFPIFRIQLLPYTGFSSS